MILPFHMNVSCGTSIRDAVIDAIELSRVANHPVAFKFNDIKVECLATSSVDERVEFYQQQMHAASEAYKLTSEYAAREVKRRVDLIMRQSKIDTLLEELPWARTATDILMAWLGDFAAINDNTELVFDKRALAQRLIAVGWTPNACLGHPEVKTNRRIYAEWAIGQAIDMLMRGMPIHPIMSEWAKHYAKMKL